MNRSVLKNIILIIPAVVLISACHAEEAANVTETETETQQIIDIEAETNEDISEIIPMEIDGALLPTLNDVTTAADNAVLAPVNLRTGNQHRVVLALQERLMSLGYMDNDEPTTYYGPSTADSISHFQRQLGMDQDGICGAETWDRLFAVDAPYYKVKNGDSGNDIIEIQQRLYELGYLMDNSITGHYGDNTENAVKKMQERNGIKADGEVGKESMNLLYSDSVKANLIGLGEKSELVQHFQERLIALGYLRDAADGNFGKGTEKAVREFQSRNDLVVDGYLGPGTRATLDDPSARPFGLRMGDRSDTVRTVQKRLAHYGYLSSSLCTGYYGSATEAAVKQFQKYNGLSQDGTVGKQTMSKLESDNAKKKPANVAQAAASAGGSGGGKGSSAGVGSGGSTVSGSAGNLISIAKSKLGCKYVWGAKGPNTFDCSGFVYYCLNQAGVRQSYMSSYGWKNPGRYQKISSIDSLQAGDIIVVSGHVGICAGNGTVIDASSSNGRVVHRTLSSWWRRNFIVGWRIFG